MKRGRPLLAVAALSGLCAALYLPGIRTLPPVDRDEALYAQAARQMLASGDLIVPRVGDDPRLIKPIGIYWLQAGALRLAGDAVSGIAAQRLPSVIGAWLAVLGTWWIGRRRLAPPAAVLGAALLASAALLVVEAHLATTDAVLLASVVAAQGCLAALLADARRGGPGSAVAAAGFWLAQGVAVLIKGPVAPLVSGLTVMALLLAAPARERAAARRLLVALRPWWGVPLAATCAAPWLLALGQRVGWQAFPQAMASDLLPKLGGTHESHGGPPGLYLLLAPLGFWPGSVVLLFAVASAWRRRRRPAERFLLAWLVPTWVFFECVPTKLPHYVLPTFPALALLAGRGALDAAARLRPRLRHGAVRAVLCAWALLGIGFGVFIAAAAWWLEGDASARAAAGLAASAAAATSALCLRSCWHERLGRAALTGIAGAVIVYALVLDAVLPHLASLWLSRQVAELTRARGATSLVAVGYAEPSLRLTTGIPIDAADPAEAAARLTSHTGGLAVVSAEQLAAFADAAAQRHVALRHVGSVEGLDYTHGRWLALHVFEAHDQR